MNYAANAYARASYSALTPREAESEVLLKAAQQLVAAGQSLAAGDTKRLNEALTFNQRLWTLFAMEATSDENPLPPDIRAGVSRLGAFVLNSCIDTMIAPTAEKLARLVSINSEVAAGLKGNPR